MRNLHTVISQLLEAIPASQEQLVANLTKLQKDLGYQPPELMYESWHRAAHILQNGVDEAANWAIVVRSIFNNDPSLLSNEITA
jgi:hypothetical protein